MDEPASSVAPSGPESVQSDAPSRLKPIGFIAVVFLLGGVSGVAGARAYWLNENKPSFGRPSVEKRVDSMDRYLDLSDTQARAISSIIRETDEEKDRALVPCRADLDAARSKGNTRIREQLDEKQRVQYDQAKAQTTSSASAQR
ncbi:MAG: hypothetical protein HOW73_05690 [Polyangiaceae bacterium]|nr:hypothetical protein [Polyangiaceae bacterium]